MTKSISVFGPPVEVDSRRVCTQCWHYSDRHHGPKLLCSLCGCSLATSATEKSLIEADGHFSEQIEIGPLSLSALASLSKPILSEKALDTDPEVDPNYKEDAIRAFKKIQEESWISRSVSRMTGRYRR